MKCMACLEKKEYSHTIIFMYVKKDPSIFKNGWEFFLCVPSMALILLVKV